MSEEIKNEEVKDLLKKNLELTEEIYKMTKKIKHFITFQQVMSVIYIILIVAPIILGIVFLPPLLKNIFSQYQGLLGGEDGGNLMENLLKSGGGGLDLKNLNLGGLNLDKIDVNQLSPELRKMVK